MEKLINNFPQLQNLNELPLAVYYTQQYTLDANQEIFDKEDETEDIFIQNLNYNTSLTFIVNLMQKPISKILIPNI